jgi:hypothetical protein
MKFWRILRAMLDEFFRGCNPKMKRFTLPTFDMGRAKVNLADRDQLYDVLDGR